MTINFSGLGQCDTNQQFIVYFFILVLWYAWMNECVSFSDMSKDLEWSSLDIFLHNNDDMVLSCSHFWYARRMGESVRILHLSV